MSPRTFSIDVPAAVLDDIRARVAAFPWHEMPIDGGWNYGANLDYMRSLSAYWVDHYDWRAAEARLNALPQFMAEADGLDLHYIHERGSGPNPVPLIITHGWPGSVAEFAEIIGPLAHPERHGGDPADAFDVIAPSLPGFGFSAKPARPIGPRRMAAHLDALMTEVLGYDGYVAQGGDWGSAVSSWLGFDHAPACRAIHLNCLTMRAPGGSQSDAEKDWAKSFATEQEMLEGYRVLQATRPQSLSYAMMDSPVGIAAWIIEKFHDWSDLTEGDLDQVYRRDDLLTNVMIYIVTRSFNTASWIYYGRREEGGRTLSPEGLRVEVPTGCALFPKELLSWPPRSYVERIYNVTHWSEMSHGGHFAAMEQPQMLVDDIRAFARSLR